jgi:hypothetical protein
MGGYIHNALSAAKRKKKKVQDGQKRKKGEGWMIVTRSFLPSNVSTYW